MAGTNNLACSLVGTLACVARSGKRCAKATKHNGIADEIGISDQLNQMTFCSPAPRHVIAFRRVMGPICHMQVGGLYATNSAIHTYIHTYILGMRKGDSVAELLDAVIE